LVAFTERIEKAASYEFSRRMKISCFLRSLRDAIYYLGKMNYPYSLMLCLNGSRAF